MQSVRRESNAPKVKVNPFEYEYPTNINLKNK